MNYSLFSFEAVVDFIEIEIYTATRTRGDIIHRQCGTRAVPIDKGAGNYATAFKIKLHDPKNYAALRSSIQSIESIFPFARAPTVTMIEVAFDGRRKEKMNSATSGDLPMLAARMAHFVANPVSDDIRLYKGKASADFCLPASVDSLATKMCDGWNVAIGNVESKWKRQDARYQHIYFKTVDQQQALPHDRHSARFEIRLAGAGLPYSDIESWKGFKFETLARHMKWRKEKDAMTPIESIILTRPGASHRKGFKRHVGGMGGQGGGTREFVLPADQALNRIAANRLQSLTAKWASGGEKLP